MFAVVRPEDCSEQPEPTQRRDLRLEMKVKNNVLWHAIYDRFSSISAFCRAHPELGKHKGRISNLLNFKCYPFQRARLEGGAWYITNEYRPVCRLLEKVLAVPAEELFPRELYDGLIDQQKDHFLEISSFTALPGATRQVIKNLSAPAEEDPKVIVDQILLRERLRRVLKTLSDHEREILKLRYGIPDGRTQTIDELAKLFGVPRERVRQIEAKALRKLQQPSRSQELEGFL